MQTIKHLGQLYDVVDWINFSSTTHLIIERGSDFEYINYQDGHYYIPPLDISNNELLTSSNKRKQFILRYLIQFLDARKIDNIDEARRIVILFKQFIKTSNVDLFLYWPIEDDDFDDELKSILKDLEFFLEQEFDKEIVENKTKEDFCDDAINEYMVEGVKKK